MIEKSEFTLWRQSEVYGEFAKFIRETMSDAADKLINRKSCDNEADMYIRGLLNMAQSVLEWEPDFPAPPDQGEPDEA
jgi:hypothetical protein